MLLGIVYQFISMFSFGIGNVLWKLPQKSFGVVQIILLRSIISVILIGGLALYISDFKGALNEWMFALIISAISFLGLAFYNLSIKYSTVSQSITIRSIGALFGVLTSAITYNEVIKWNLWISLLIIVIGLFLLENKKPILNWSKGAYYAILAAFFWGTTFALFRIPANALGEVNFSFVLEFTVLSCALVGFLFQKPKNYDFIPTIRTYLTIVFIGVLGFLGVLFYNKAVTLMDVSTLAVLGTFTPVISIGVSHILLKERFKPIQYVGMGLTVGAVLLLMI